MKTLRLIILLTSIFVTNTFAQIDHSSWDELLKSHVKNGKVDYKGFINDSDKLDSYLELISTNAPNKKWEKAEKLAYWINAYNAYTIKLIIDNYPLESIQDLHPTIKIPGISTVWHKEFFQIGGEDCSLNEIEHKILRKQFDEPRIHFAINCASVSCPDLWNEAFVAEKIEEQLAERAKVFINDSTKNKISNTSIEISRIFSWFKKDFTKKGSLISYLNRYAKVKISEDADVDYMEYNWSLNE